MTQSLLSSVHFVKSPNRWKPYELKAVLLAFSEYKDSDSTTYMFMYSGAEGNEFTQLIKPILLKLKYEGNQKISRSELRLLEQKLGSEVITFLLQVDSRFILEKLGTWEDIRQRDLRTLRKLIVERSRSRPEEGFEERIYNQLFVEVAEKTQGASKYFRKLNRARVLDLLQVAEHALTNQIESFGVSISSWLSYLASVKNAFHKWYMPNELEELVQWNVVPVPINEYIRLKPQFNPSLLTETRQEAKGKNLPDLSLNFAR